MKMTGTCLAMLITAIVYAQATSDPYPRWTDSFDSLKANIRVLDEPAKKECECRLRQILKSLDDGPSCSADTECTLLNQDPFGATVPAHVSQAKKLLADMKQFAEFCDNHTTHSFQNNGTVSIPSCAKKRCVVLTSLAPRH
jgi:hypothetical protein